MASYYVLATGEGHSVRDFVEKAFAHVGKIIVCRGSSVGEKGIEKSSGRVLVEIDPVFSADRGRYSAQ